MHTCILLLTVDKSSVPEVFHTHPSHHDPYPSHYARQNDQGGIVSHNGKGGVVFQFRRCVGSLAYVPCPTPDTEDGTHADCEDEPCYDEYDPSPPFRLAVIVFDGKGFYGGKGED